MCGCATSLQTDEAVAHVFCSDIHVAALSSTGDDSLARASKGEIQGEVILIFGVDDGHIVSVPCGTGTITARPDRELSADTLLISTMGNIPTTQPKEGRSLIRDSLTDATVQPKLKLSFLELQASHAFIRDEMSKGRFDAAISKVCFELLLETFGRTIGRDLGQKQVDGGSTEQKLVC